MLDFNEYLDINEIVGYGNVKENLLSVTQYAVNNYFADKPLFKDNNFKYYFYDDYVFNTNTSINNYMTLYVEINQPQNVKEAQNKRFIKKDPNIKDLHLSLQNIKDGIFQELLNCFDSNTLLWQEQYSINLSINERVDGKKINYLFRVIPCFTYKNENNINGVVYYNNDLNKVEIEYPVLSTKNIKAKEKNTNKLYLYYDVLLKNILQAERKENYTYFEIFESLLYNVPDKLFEDKTEKTLIQILNFLRNNNLKEYKTIDEQDYMFTSKYKSFSILYVKHALNQIEKYIKKSQKNITSNNE